MTVIHIGGEADNFLEIAVRGPTHPYASHLWDRTWLSCTATAKAGMFEGSADGEMLVDELIPFLESLRALYERRTMDAALETMEQWLVLRFTGDDYGHIEVGGELRNEPFATASLRFTLRLDQTYLPPIIRRVQRLIDEYGIP